MSITRDDIMALAVYNDSTGYWTNDDDHEYATPQTMVKYFQRVTQQKSDPALYEALITEEFHEWCESTDYTHELKELADLVYVIYGYANAMGWNLDEALYRVHVNNIGRIKQPDGSIKRREDGKIIKNPDYPKVNLGDLV